MEPRPSALQNFRGFELVGLMNMLENDAKAIISDSTGFSYIFFLYNMYSFPTLAKLSTVLLKSRV